MALALATYEKEYLWISFGYHRGDKYIGDNIILVFSTFLVYISLVLKLKPADIVL